MTPDEIAVMVADADSSLHGNHGGRDTWDAYMQTARHVRALAAECESLLTATFSGEWVINELCPFNGIYCRFGDVKDGV